ncbi:MAG: T9SS type A sorting domain-containing protein [Bacteroidetes bacterium]|nr:T9SS type A sorting domain-containing protein [Bacteroidota bacterium]
MFKHFPVLVLKTFFLIPGFLFLLNSSQAQKLVLMDYNHGNKVVNDDLITIDTTDLNALELNAHLRIQNNTDKPLALFMKKIINQMVDSTSNYFCLYPKCWPDADSTDVADSIPAGLSDSSFVTHYDHFFRYERPVPPGLTSITYFFYDHTTFPEPVEARVTVNYRISGVGIGEQPTKKISVYPIPANKETFISIDRPITGIAVIDMDGREIRDVQWTKKSDKIILQLDSFTNGIYLARLFDHELLVQTVKLIVCH